MHELIRSLSVLGLGFTGVLVVTLGFATLLQPGPAGSAQVGGAPSTEAAATPPPVDGPVTDVGGMLTVTGDRAGLLILDREVTELGYALAGPEGRVFFGGDPLEVERISYAGLQLYVDPGECELTPGDRYDPTGVAAAELRCDAVNDIHGDGTVSIAGTVGISADLLGLRGDLPPERGHAHGRRRRAGLLVRGAVRRVELLRARGRLPADRRRSGADDRLPGRGAGER